jgi:hypothetical protein
MQERDELRALKRELKMSRERKVKKKNICVWKRKRKERKRNSKKDMKRMNQVKDK